MNSSIDPELVRFATKVLCGQTLNSEISFDLSKKSLILKLLSTRLVQTVLLALSGCIILLIFFSITKLQLLGILGGIGTFLTLAYALVVLLIKPDLAKSDLNVMFCQIINLFEKTLELPTTMDGESLLEMNSNDELATQILIDSPSSNPEKSKPRKNVIQNTKVKKTS